jgi:hypothetical protein
MIKTGDFLPGHSRDPGGALRMLARLARLAALAMLAALLALAAAAVVHGLLYVGDLR